MFRMAWRNLWRNRRRTLITLVSIAFGVLLTMVFTTMVAYMYGEMIDTSARMGLGHVTVEPKGYLDAPSLKLRVGDLDGLRRRALEHPRVVSALPRLQGPALFATAARSVGGAFIAVDPALESPQYNTLLKTLVEGRLFAGSNDASVVVGARLAEKLKLKLGKKLVVTVSDIHGEMASTLVRVCGIYRTGVEEVDGMTLLLPLGTAARLLGYAPGEGTALSVVIDDQRYSGQVAKELEAALDRPDAEVKPWTETQSQLADLIRVDKTGHTLIQLILGVMISMGVLNTALMSVIERRREFGIMLAVGLSPVRLIGLVLTEALWLGLLGLALGVLVSVPAYIYMQVHGLDMSSYMPKEGIEISGLMMKPIYHSLLYPQTAAAIAAITMALVLLASVYPAWRAGRVPPMDAIRNG